MADIKEAIILAGGFGTRLRSVVSDLPKPMAPVGGIPFLAYLTDYLSSKGVTRIILSVGFKHEAVVDYFGSRRNGAGIDYVIEDKPLGTGGALKEALSLVEAQDALVMNGDSFLRLDVRGLSTAHYALGGAITMAVKEMDAFDRYGAVALNGVRVEQFEEKCFRKRGYINAGVYAVNKNRCGLLEMGADCFSFERDFLPEKAGAGAVFAYVCNDYFIDIGLPEDYARAQNESSNLLKGGTYDNLTHSA